MLDKWMLASGEDIGMVLLSFVAVYIGIILYTRVTGLRSFSKMSASDFAMTVAVGSVFAATISSPSPTVVLGLVALAALFAGQWIIAAIRAKFPNSTDAIDNDPILLMARGQILTENLEQANMTRCDLFAKLREANAKNYEEVLAVVFEATGDVSVLHSGQGADAKLEPEFFEGVRGVGALFSGTS